MEREIDDCRLVGCRRDLRAQIGRFDKGIPARHGQIARKPAIAIVRKERQRDGVLIIVGDLPWPFAKTRTAAVKPVFAEKILVELVCFAIKREAAIADAVREAPRQGTVMRRMGDVILKRVQSEDDPLRTRF